MVAYAFPPAIRLTGDVSYLYNFYLNQGLGVSPGDSYHITVYRTERIKSTLPEKPQPMDETKVKRTGSGLELNNIELDNPEESVLQGQINMAAFRDYHDKGYLFKSLEAGTEE